MADEVRDVLVERRRGRRRVGLPFRGLRELVESTDDLEGRVARRLANALVVMLRELSELERALLSIWREVLARRGKERAHRVSGDVLLDSNSRVGVQHLGQRRLRAPQRPKLRTRWSSANARSWV